MRVRIPQKELNGAANIVSNLVGRAAGAMPILSNVLLETDEQSIIVRGTDTEALVEVRINGTVEEPGKITIPADKLQTIVRFLPEESEIILNHEDGKAHILCDKNEYNLLTIPADDFPIWQVEPGISRFQLNQKALRHLIAVTEYALPTKDPRRVLLGVYFELKDHALRLTATDGKKLSRISVDVPEIEGDQNTAIIVPGRFMADVRKALSDEGLVDVEMSPRQIMFSFNNCTFRSNSIPGKYPDCDAVIPKEFPQEIRLNRDAFIAAARRAGIVSDEKSHSIVLSFHDNKCEFSSMAHDLGTFNGELSLEYDGPPLEIALNYQFLQDTLNSIHNPEVRMKIKSHEAPIVFTAEGEEDRLILLMPIKLSEVRRKQEMQEI